MGDCQNGDLRVRFDGRLKLKFLGSQVTTDAGLVAYRELDEAFGLTQMGADGLRDARLGRNKQHGLVPLLRQSIYSRLAGYEDVNDAERLCVDPAMRHVVGGRASQAEKRAASCSEVGRFETEILSQPSNLESLQKIAGTWIDRVHQAKPIDKIVLDMDSSVSETYGRQEGTAYNGHFACTCYHPLFCFNQFGDLEQALLRNGNAHSAENWRAVLEPVVARYRDRNLARYFRGDAAFAKPDLYEFLEAEGYEYAIRLPANDVLEQKIRHLLTRPVGRPPKKPIVLYGCFLYRAASWNKWRRVVAKVEWHEGELFPRVGFIVTSLWIAEERVVRFYNGRGTAEQWIKEGKQAIKWTRLSCRRFAANQVRLQLFVLAYNLANFVRRLALPQSIRRWSLTTLREKLTKIGAKVVRHAGYVTFQLAEVAVPRRLFGQILARIERLRQAVAPAPS
jgi:hypothetical protein